METVKTFINKRRHFIKQTFGFGLLLAINPFKIFSQEKKSEKKMTNIEEKYIVPAQTRIGHSHLKVADLERSLKFYRDLLGFEVTSTLGDQAAFISAGGYHHHIGLNTWYSKGFPNASKEGVGLYHTAIVYPTRKDLAKIYDRLLKANYPVGGASDHGVSESIYLDDPDGNGVELYWDRPRELWKYQADGSLEIFAKPIDLKNLLKELDK